MCQQHPDYQDQLLNALLEFGNLEGVPVCHLDWTHVLWEHCQTHGKVDFRAHEALRFSQLAGGWFEFSPAPNQREPDHRFIVWEWWHPFHESWKIRQEQLQRRKDNGMGPLLG